MSNTKQPTVSVITTFYNAEQFLLNAVNSVFNQTIDNTFDIEYVIVDDKSPDKSRKMLEEYIKQHSKKNFYWRLVEPDKNLGCGGARKFGIENAGGDYFMFLDADDYYIRPDFVIRALNDLKSNHADVVEYGVIYNQADGSQANASAPQKFVIENTHDMEMLLFKDNLIKFNVWSKIYTREIVMSHPYSDARTFEDVRTIPIWISHCKKVVIMPTPEINYRAAGGSIIRTNWVETRLGTISAMVSLLPTFKHDYQLVKAMYGRAMIDIDALCNNHSSENEGFNEMSRLNTEFLKILYPDDWQKKVYHVEDDLEIHPEKKDEIRSKYIKTDLNKLPQ